MEDNISGIVDRMEEMDKLDNDNVKCKIFLTQNTQETMERQNLRIIEIEGGELQLKGQKDHKRILLT